MRHCDRRPLLVLTAAVAGLLGGCRKAPRPTAPAQAVPTSTSEIPRAPVAGALRGRPFSLRNARYYVDARPGYEHVDIQLNEGGAAEPCGALDPADGARVWLRRKGAQALQIGEIRFENGSAGPWEAHYQLQEDGRWVGQGDAQGVLSIRRMGVDDRVVGDLSLCFQGAESCVSGTFTATRCPIALDVVPRGGGALMPPSAPPRR